jgi:hypothetical protein
MAPMSLFMLIACRTMSARCVSGRTALSLQINEFSSSDRSVARVPEKVLAVPSTKDEAPPTVQRCNGVETTSSCGRPPRGMDQDKSCR